MRKGISTSLVRILILSISLVIVSGCCTEWSKEVCGVLKQAEGNRGELEKVLKHYRDREEFQKLSAAEFLIENMPGQKYIIAGFYDEKGNEAEFDALDYKNLDEAQAAMDELEKKHGKLNYKRKEFHEDIKTITAEYLIENIDLAFETWRENPWAKGLSFEAFCEHILPYRCSNEPINRWRKVCMDRYRDLRLKMKDPSDVAEAAGLIGADVHKRVRFDSLYYLHPTDQGFDEMSESGKGRCEDISNMISYAMRANGIAVGSDYTPAWANRDNNHAWNAILDENGKGSAPIHNVAAKIYRKTFSIQKDNPVFMKKESEDIPRWLAGENFRDVTGEYFETSTFKVELEKDVPGNATFAYLCVFNGGEWTPICAGLIKGNSATFEDVGRGIVYLPGYYVDDEVVSAAAPFVLDKQGQVHRLNGNGQNGESKRIEITTVKPATGDDDTLVEIPQIVVEADKVYEMFYWDDEWESLGKKTAGDSPVEFDSLPANRLYWMVEEDSRKLERIFTIEGNVQKWW